jgi:hypothetical protein
VIDPVAICEGMGIIFSHIYPPIPTKEFDWGCCFDGDEENGELAYGETKDACAVNALRELNYIGD